MEFVISEENSTAKITVIGIGGCGGNAVDAMLEKGLKGLEFVSANTDLSSLETGNASKKIQLGPQTSKGLGAGADPQLGQLAAEESLLQIRESLKDSNMVFIIAGLGGGTGTGAAPIIAKVCKEVGALTVAVVTKPFTFEGKARAKQAESGWVNLKKQVDTIITIQNDRIFQLVQKNTPFLSGMKMVDNILVQAVKGITDLVNLPGYINPDLADVCTIMNEMGPALMGIGFSVGENRATEAVNMAIASPFLQDISIDGAKGVLVNISAKEDTLTMREVTAATESIYNAVNDDANIILGVIFDENLGDELSITITATGVISGNTEQNLVHPNTTQHIKNEAINFPVLIEEPRPTVSLVSAKEVEQSITQKEPKYNKLEDHIIVKVYDLFIDHKDNNERSHILKSYRDEIFTKDDYGENVSFINALWHLSGNCSIKTVSDYAERIFKTITSCESFSSEAIVTYYSYIYGVCKCKNIQDIAMIGGKQNQEQNQHDIPYESFISIPELFFDFKDVILQIHKIFSESNVLLNVNEILKKLDTIFSLSHNEKETPEEYCLFVCLKHTLSIIEKYKKSIFSNIKKEFKSYYPIYKGRWNDAELLIDGIPKGFKINIVTRKSNDNEIDISNPLIKSEGLINSVKIKLKPLIVGELTFVILLEGIAHEITINVLSESPFIVGSPVQNQDLFVGRMNVLDKVHEAIISPSNPSNVLITGRRRIGKTSLLYAVRRRLPNGVIPCMLSTETCGKTPKTVCRGLSNGIYKDVKKNNLIKNLQSPKISVDDPIGDFLEWIDILGNKIEESKAYSLILLIDEASAIIEWENDVQSLLRYLVSNRLWLRSVMVAHPDIIGMMHEDILSQIFNVFITMKLGPITFQDTDLLIENTLRSNGIAIDMNIVNLIYENAGGIPYYIQCIGKEIFEYFKYNKKLDVQSFDEILETSKERLATSYPVLLNKLPPAEIITLISISKDINPPEASAKKLEDADLIELIDSKWTINSKFERDWISDMEDKLIDKASIQLWEKYGSSINLSLLSDELKKLQEEESVMSNNIVKDAIIQAGEAAKVGNGAKVIKFLGATGKWTLDIATKIGTDVAAATIKQTYGL